MKVIKLVLVSLFCLSIKAQKGIDIAESAYLLTFDNVVYDPNYYSIPYPNGDVPGSIGVCSDVVIRLSLIHI